MNTQEYIQSAIRTKSDMFNLPRQGPVSLGDPTHLPVDVLHAIMGVATEAGELLEAMEADDTVNRDEEIGDVLWYCAIYADCRGSGYDYGHSHLLRDAANPHLPKPIPAIVNAMAIDSLRLLDIAKKSLFYAKPIDYTLIDAYFGCIFNSILEYVAERGVPDLLADIMSRNIAKLRRRFPQQFDSDQAINRDHAAERVVLEERK